MQNAFNFVGDYKATPPYFSDDELAKTSHLIFG